MATAQAVTDTKIISIHALLAESDRRRNTGGTAPP